MALVKFGGGVIQLSGKIAGNVFAKNSTSSYVRSWRKPVNPNTQLQDNIRRAMQYLTNYWSDVLSDANRALWETYANAIAMKNKLGETVKLSGFNHFIRSNIIWYKNEGSVKAVGPSELTLPASAGGFAVAAASAGQSISISFTNTEEWALEVGSRLWVFEGQARNITRNFFGGPWRYLVAVAGAEPAPTSPEIHATSWGFAAGQKISVYGRVQRADGRLSGPFTAECVAT